MCLKKSLPLTESYLAFATFILDNSNQLLRAGSCSSIPATNLGLLAANANIKLKKQNTYNYEEIVINACTVYIRNLLLFCTNIQCLFHQTAKNNCRDKKVNGL